MDGEKIVSHGGDILPGSGTSHLGSIRELTDSSETVRARYDYDPYGRMTKISGDRDSLFTYTGHFWHAQSGLELTQYRAYDPDLGRWLSRDPLGEAGGINLYKFCFGNPISLVDPNGMSPLAEAVPVAVGFAIADGPIPVGDAIGAAIIVGAGVWTAVDAARMPNSIPDEDSDAKRVPAPPGPPCNKDRCTCYSRIQLIDLSGRTTVPVFDKKISASAKTCPDAAKKLHDYGNQVAAAFGVGYQLKHVNQTYCVTK